MNDSRFLSHWKLIDLCHKRVPVGLQLPRRFGVRRSNCPHRQSTCCRTCSNEPRLQAASRQSRFAKEEGCSSCLICNFMLGEATTPPARLVLRYAANLQLPAPQEAGCLCPKGPCQVPQLLGLQDRPCTNMRQIVLSEANIMIKPHTFESR